MRPFCCERRLPMIASAPAAPAAGPARLVWPARQVPAGWLIAALLGWLALDQLLLWRFLGFAPLWPYPLAVLLVAGMGRVILRAMPDRTGPTVATLLACFTSGPLRSRAIVLHEATSSSRRQRNMEMLIPGPL